jgi:hypothetical protein
LLIIGPSDSPAPPLVATHFGQLPAMADHHGWRKESASRPLLLFAVNSTHVGSLGESYHSLSNNPNCQPRR